MILIFIEYGNNIIHPKRIEARKKIKYHKVTQIGDVENILGF